MPWNTQTAFLEACRAGDIDSVNAMIAQNYHPDVRSVTILRLQSFLLISGMLYGALSQSRDPRSFFLNGVTAFFTDMSLRRLPDLLGVGFIDLRDPHVITAAIQGGSLAVLNRLLSISVVARNAAVNHNQPLRMAVALQRIDLVQSLLRFPVVLQHINEPAISMDNLNLMFRYTQYYLERRLEGRRANRDFLLNLSRVFLEQPAIYLAFINQDYDMVNLLQNHGAVLAPELRLFHQINPDQSAHLISIHKTVSESAKKLQLFYKNPSKQETQKAIHSLIFWLKQQPASEYQRAAIACVQNGTVTQREFVDARSEVSLKQVFALVWMGINDASFSEAERINRRNTFLRCLYEIQREYNFSPNDDSANPMDLGEKEDQPTCMPGIFTKLMYALNAVGHKEVNVIYVTSQTINNKAKLLPKKVFFDLDKIECQYFAKNWNAENPEKIQAEFFEKCRPIIFNLLKTEFDEFSDSIQNYNQVIKAAVDNIHYIDMTEVMSQALMPVPVLFSRSSGTSLTQAQEACEQAMKGLKL